MSDLLSGRRVAIVGGGPAGLTLARLLQMKGVALTVYERDASATVRGQGGSLDLHLDSGQLALAEAGLMDGFVDVARPEGQHATIYDAQGAVRAVLAAQYETEPRPEIDRGALRDLLLRSLEPGTVVWAKRLAKADRDRQGRPQLHFADGEVQSFDLVVGCDGGWSHARPLVSEAVQPTYSGVTLVQTLVGDAGARHPDVAALVGPGSVLALGDGRGLLAQANGDGSIRVYVALCVPEDWIGTCGLDFGDPQTTRRELLKKFGNWSPRLTRMLEASDDEFQPWPLYAYPARQVWRPRSDVTLLGDAAHIMPPFTGRGVNFAMLDALDLARNLTSGRFADIGAAIAAYERDMLGRMADAVEDTLSSQAMMFAADAPAALAAHVREALGLAD